jgi:hypothetical protein
MPTTAQPEKKTAEKQAEEESKKGSLFTFRTDVGKTSWHRKVSEQDKHIQIAVERLGNPDGMILCDQISPHLLFSLAPALQNELLGRRIVLPSSAALDDEAINDVVNAILDCAREGKPLAMQMQRAPVRLMKVHVVFVLFGMQKEADALLSSLWELVGSKELKLADISWIWDTFADPVGKRWSEEEYVAPAGPEYIQMMAWQVVNMDAAGKLDEDVKTSIEMEMEPRYLYNMLKTRVDKFGLGRELIASAREAATPVDGELSPENGGVEQPEASVATAQASRSSSSGKLDAILEDAPRFTSAGFMTCIELPKANVSESPPMFGQPEQKSNLWGGGGGGGTSPRNAFEKWYRVC